MVLCGGFFLSLWEGGLFFFEVEWVGIYCSFLLWYALSSFILVPDKTLWGLNVLLLVLRLSLLLLQLLGGDFLYWRLLIVLLYCFMVVFDKVLVLSLLVFEVSLVIRSMVPLVSFHPLVLCVLLSLF